MSLDSSVGRAIDCRGIQDINRSLVRFRLERSFVAMVDFFNSPYWIDDNHRCCSDVLLLYPYRNCLRISNQYLPLILVPSKRKRWCLANTGSVEEKVRRLLNNGSMSQSLSTVGARSTRVVDLC